MDQRSRRAPREYPAGETNDPTSSEPNSLDVNLGSSASGIDVRLAQDFLALGPAIRILQLNVEGLSAAKRTLIGTIAIEQNIDIICLQETHIDKDESRLFTIQGYDLISYVLHAKHGRATYVIQDLADAQQVRTTKHCDIIRVGGFHVANVYKPPSENWQESTLPILPHPAVYVGDFNSHHTQWGYNSACRDGEALAEWASANDFHLVYDPKQKGTFRSARWNQEYNPDLCWVSSAGNCPQPARVSVLTDIAHQSSMLVCSCR